MKKIGCFALIALFSIPTWADVNLDPLLNKVTLTLQSEQWVTTKTALVEVAVNASVTDQGIEKIQGTVLDKLKQFSDKSEWHIISFNRQQDKSELESIQINAQARLPQTDLANLRSKAKTMSKPGETYTVSNVQFIPSEDEIRAANAVLRNQIYQQAKTEIDVLNKAYPDQKYYVHQIDFQDMSPRSMPIPLTAASVMMNKVVSAAPFTVGNKVQLQAMVVLAAMPDPVVQNLTHVSSS